MKHTYATHEEVTDTLASDNRIVGIVELSFETFVGQREDISASLYHQICQQLVSTSYADCLSDIHYRLVYANTQKEMLMLMVSAKIGSFVYSSLESTTLA